MQLRSQPTLTCLGYKMTLKENDLILVCFIYSRFVLLLLGCVSVCLQINVNVLIFPLLRVQIVSYCVIFLA